MTLRIFAIDWSGAAVRAEKKIWLAEARDGQLARLECGRGRDEVTQLLVVEAARDPKMIVGLDFAFSMPAWFFAKHRLASVVELWELAEREGEAWLAACKPPFWGRPGCTKPADVQMFRETELAVAPVAGVRPKSVFQIGGAGAVGTGSIRGMPILIRLHRAGFNVWPFAGDRLPVVVEIYPRILTGPVRKSDRAARVTYLRDMREIMSNEVLAKAESCEDAFDAAISALKMWEHRGELLALARATEPTQMLEGKIWVPSTPVRTNGEVVEVA